jgi:hypothetical protein
LRRRVGRKDFTDRAITGVIDGEAIIEVSATKLNGDAVRIIGTAEPMVKTVSSPTTAPPQEKRPPS